MVQKERIKFIPRGPKRAPLYIILLNDGHTVYLLSDYYVLDVGLITHPSSKVCIIKPILQMRN